MTAIDVYWSVATADLLLQGEMNPLGRALIRADHGSVALFMGLKVAGSVTALGVMIFLRRYWLAVAQGVTWGIFALEMMLLWYLNYG